MCIRDRLTTKTPWHDHDGKIIGTFGTARNITDLKLAEAKVEKAHQQLLETSRLAGMAEVATSVLHNVGNVLNNVNICLLYTSGNMKPPCGNRRRDSSSFSSPCRWARCV